MGGIVSNLPEKLSEDDLKQICGDKYNPAIYNSLKDGEGFVSRDQFLTALHDSEEREVHSLFISFCPNGEMDSRSFVKICKDTKLLNKKNFSTTDADLIFSTAKNHQGSAKTINYNTFRHFALDKIATKKSMEMPKIIQKLARCEGPHLHGTHAEAVRFHDDQSTYTGAHAHGGPTTGDDTGGVRMENLLDRGDADVRGVAVPAATPSGEAATEEHHKAAQLMQGVSRKKAARRRVEGLKEVRDAGDTVNPDEHFDTPVSDCDVEAKLRDVFMKFCPSSEMDSKTFVKMCRDTGIITRKFTAGDADLVFQKAKARASAPTAGAYSSGVVHGKRVSFDVFRAVAVPCIAEKLSVEPRAVVEKLAASDGPTLHNTTTAQANRFHDDKSTYTGQHAAS